MRVLACQTGMEGGYVGPASGSSACERCKSQPSKHHVRVSRAVVAWVCKSKALPYVLV